MGIGDQEWLPHGFAAGPAPTRVDLNTITFEQLRALGLTPAETTRFLAARERRRFDSLEAVERVDGLPAHAVAALRRAGTV